MSYKIPTYPIYDTVYRQEIPTAQLYVETFNILPSFTCEEKHYRTDILNYFLEEKMTIISKICDVESRRNIRKILLLKKYANIMFYLQEYSDSKTSYFKITFYYDISLGELNQQIDFDFLKKYEQPIDKFNINIITKIHGEFVTQGYDLNVEEMDLGLNYGKDFLKIHNLISDRLNTPNSKGLVLLHGEPGTGKTTYIKYLSKIIKDKEIIFIPPSLSEFLMDPSMISFLMDYKNSILIIEDAEKVISDRETSGSVSGVSNILNLTDGILSDCLNIQVIATFNMKKDKIDKALLRKGRLIAEHKFDYLNIEDTNTLLKHLNKDTIVNEPMTLAQIYNIDVEQYTAKTKNKIGLMTKK